LRRQIMQVWWWESAHAVRAVSLCGLKLVPVK
jgi:hypothetical protein